MKSVVVPTRSHFNPLLPFFAIAAFLILVIFSLFILTKLIIWLKQNFTVPQSQPVANTYTQMPIIWDTLKTKVNGINLINYGS